ncbi:MAG: peptidase [Clostridiales bacterium]|jgi:signal peptidase II|nr:peptidase [Clostridiales bacterium]
MKLMFKNPLWKVICIFVSMWLVYYILELFSGNIQGIYGILINLIAPALFLSLMAVIFYTLSLKITSGFNSKKIVLIIFILIIIEQVTKLIIRSAPNIGSSYELIADWLYFYPTLNTSGSWGASRFGLTLGIKIFLLINIIFIPLVVQIFRFHVKENGSSFWGNITFVLCFSGIVCSMIDKMFFGGSLDFLMLNNLFVADIKDFYITLSIGCLLVEVFLNSKFNSKSSFKDDFGLIKRFIMFNKNNFKELKKLF